MVKYYCCCCIKGRIQLKYLLSTESFIIILMSLLAHQICALRYENDEKGERGHIFGNIKFRHQPNFISNFDLVKNIIGDSYGDDDRITRIPSSRNHQKRRSMEMVQKLDTVQYYMPKWPPQQNIANGKKDWKSRLEEAIILRQQQEEDDAVKVNKKLNMVKVKDPENNYDGMVVLKKTFGPRKSFVKGKGRGHRHHNCKTKLTNTRGALRPSLNFKNPSLNDTTKPGHDEKKSSASETIHVQKDVNSISDGGKLKIGSDIQVEQEDDIVITNDIDGRSSNSNERDDFGSVKIKGKADIDDILVSPDIIVDKDDIEIVRLHNTSAAGILILLDENRVTFSKHSSTGDASDTEDDTVNDQEGFVTKEEKLSPTVCLTPECVSLSAKIIDSMNLSTNPCQDFYQYACGGWISDNVIPDGSVSWSHFRDLSQKNQYILKNIIENTRDFESTAEAKAQTYYRSCIDEGDVIESLDAKPLLDLLKRYGGWNVSLLRDANFIVPEIDVINGTAASTISLISQSFFPRDLSTNINNNTKEPSEWLQDIVEGTSFDLDLSLLFNVYVAEDDKNSSTNVIYIDTGRTSLPREFLVNLTLYENLEILAAYLRYMINVGLILDRKLEDERQTGGENTEIIEGDKKSQKKKAFKKRGSRTENKTNSSSTKKSQQQESKNGTEEVCQLDNPGKAAAKKNSSNKKKRKVITHGELFALIEGLIIKEVEENYDPGTILFKATTLTKANAKEDGFSNASVTNSTTDKIKLNDAATELSGKNLYLNYYKNVIKTMSNVLIFEAKLASVINILL